MKFRYSVIIAALFFVMGCSSPQPSQIFLGYSMRIITSIESSKEGGIETETLHMKPKDLYAVFDRDIQSRKWEKIHENSWKLVVKGKDPATKRKTLFEFTLVSVPMYNNDVIVKSISVNGQVYDSIKIIDMMRYLDKSFTTFR